MGAECVGSLLVDEPDEMPLFPPGFTSFESFNLQKIQDHGFGSDCDPSRAKMSTQCCDSRREKVNKSLRNRPCIDYSRFDNSSDEESDYELPEQKKPAVKCLPKGVSRGNLENINGQKVAARWRREDSCRPNVNGAPVFYPTEEEFNDTISYIASIQPRAEPYGICRIVPPLSWNPPCPLKGKEVWENSKFSTRVQKVDKLQNREPMRKPSKSHGVMMRKRRKVLKSAQELLNLDGNSVEAHNVTTINNNTERFGFQSGPDFTLESFQKYADEFKRLYIHRETSDTEPSSVDWEPSVEDIEGEYWRIVEKPTEQIEVLYGADLDTGVFGSGFPKAASDLQDSDIDDQYAKSGWNLNNLPRLQGSLLSFESDDISGVLVPWLYVGMCFSSFCWHVEDHHLYSLNYMHWGAPKVWYGVPGKDALKLEAAMKKHLADLFEEQPDLLHKLVTQFSPSMLKLEDVPVYRCVQHPGEFVLTFPRAYHSGFNCGFNCAEAVNVAPFDWLPHGQIAVELYRDQTRKISISHDKLLLEAARKAVKAQWNILFLGSKSSDDLRWKKICGPSGVLTKALKARIEMEKERRDYLSSPSQSGKMCSDLSATDERECFLCHYDLHLSSCSCPCAADRFACLVHAKQLCSCAWSTRIFIFRYEMDELNTLADALGGKMSAIHRWGLSDLGLKLNSFASKDKPHDSKTVKKSDVTKQMNNSQINHGRQANYGRANCLSQETKASIFKPSQDIAKERDWKKNDALSSSYKTTDQTVQNLYLTNSAYNVPIPHVGVSSEKCNAQIVHSSGYRDSCSSMLSDEHYKRSNRNCNMLQSSSNDVFPISPVFTAKKQQLVLSDDLPNAREKESSSLEAKLLLSSHDERGACGISLTRIKEEPITKNNEAFTRLVVPDKVISSKSLNNQVIMTTGDKACELNEKDGDLLQNRVEVDNTPIVKTLEVKDEVRDETFGEALSNFANEKSVGTLCSSNLGKSSIDRHVPHPSSLKKLLLDQNCVGGHLEQPFSCDREKSNSEQKVVLDSGKPSSENKVVSYESHTEYSQTCRDGSKMASTSYPQNNLDKPNRLQKTPRMAKVVRRVNCNVELLEYGVVLPGKLWSTSQAIFPKGFRSRVRYLSVLDPTQMSYYVSEILDAGLLGPLFMVTLEQCPSEVFIHASAIKCWDLVREKVNHEIRKIHNLGRANLPSLQPPGSVNGLDMFGLSFPMIIQAIEAIDKNHVCTEYWRAKPQPHLPSATPTTTDESIDKEVIENQCLHSETEVALRGLIKKATLAEVNVFSSVLSGLISGHIVEKIINEEIEARRK